MVFKVYDGLDGVAEGVEHGQVTRRFEAQHVRKGLIAMFPDRVENLADGDNHAGALEDTWLNLPEFAEEVGGEFGLGFGLFDGLPILEIILMTGFEPLREGLGSQTTAAFGQFVENDAVRKGLVEHEIDHVASWFGEAGDFLFEPVAHRQHRLLTRSISLGRRMIG